MRLYRRVAGLATVTALSLGAAACGVAEAAIDAAAAATPAGKLLAAAPDQATPAFAFATKGDCSGSISGVVDPAAKAARASATAKVPGVGAVTMSYLLIGEDKSFFSIAFKPASLHAANGVPKGWHKVDPAKVGEESREMLVYSPEILDPLGVGGLASVASGVVQDGAKYTGTIDMTRIEQAKRILPATTMTKLGDRAKAVPFEAIVDEATGTTTSFTLSPPDAKSCTAVYDKFGAVKKVSAPKAKKATAALYRLLGA
ncbi:hypothetical protein Q0Z83_062870 [Actinoplanes sichuanensis]|uniref:Lipoprotein n=1 Tax=Actinoplanes sichuanensis TaxID=512349 RepID=A0ABW4A029_9ACTN|nr:hypothetical protein [Actinoplanes sichuanensis]BEL08096.1 hypothetical protein Q0Z83_062870 [Actinoplanes sichuanensis]